MKFKSIALSVVCLSILGGAVLLFGGALTGATRPSDRRAASIAVPPTLERIAIDPWIVLDDDGRQYRVDNGVVLEVSSTAVTLRDRGFGDRALRAMVRIERLSNGTVGARSQVSDDSRVSSRFDPRSFVRSESGELLLKQSDDHTGDSLGIRQLGDRSPSGEFFTANLLEILGDLRLADGTSARIAIVDVAQRRVLWSSAEFLRSWPNPVEPQRVIVTGKYVRNGPQKLGVVDFSVAGAASFTDIAVGNDLSGILIGFAPGGVPVSVAPRDGSVTPGLYEVLRLGATRFEFPYPPAEWALTHAVNRLIGSVFVYLAESSDVILWNLETSKTRQVRLIGRTSSARLFSAIDDKSQLWITDGRSVWFIGSVLD